MEELLDSEDILTVQRVLAGDVDAFSGLVERHAGGIRRFCSLRLGHAEDAEDAAQDVFLRAYKSLATFRLGSSFRAWLYGIAANRVKTRYGRRERDRSLRMKAEAESAVLSDGGALGNAETAALEALEAWAARTAIGRLRPNNREAAELYYVAGLSVEEIAESLKIGREAVKSRLFRARKEIMDAMTGNATGTERKG